MTDPTSDALAMPTGVHYTTWLDQITPTLVALGWTPPPGPADSPDVRRDRIAEAIRQAAERCECDGSCVCGLGIDCYLGSRTDVVVVGKPEAIAAAVLSAGSVPAELTEAQRYCGCDCVNCSGCLGYATPEQDEQAEGVR